MPTSSFSQSWIAAMKNVLADGRLTQSGEGGRAGTALAHPPTTLIPQARPGVGYICGLWDVGAARPVQQPEQTR